MECSKIGTQKSINKAIGIFKSERIPLPIEYINQIQQEQQIEKTNMILKLKKSDNREK